MQFVYKVSEFFDLDFTPCTNTHPTALDRKNLHCSYASKSTSRQRDSREQLRHQSILQETSHAATASGSVSPNLAPQILSRNRETDRESDVLDYPSVYFLDSKIARLYQIKLPDFERPLPPYISSIIGDFSQRLSTAKIFFESIHKWLPIVSKKHFYENISPLCPVRPDYALLIMCMGLTCWVPEPHIRDARTSAYLAAKRYQLDLETSGVLSIQALQAGILIATFELGHAIYPSAFLSVAACARHGTALGLDWDSNCTWNKPLCWVDVEEQNRVWWAVVLLDRYAFRLII